MNSVVIYARFSDGKQSEQSIEGQLKVCYDFAQKNGYTVVKEYIDRALTGTSDKRPQFQKMITDSAKRQFQSIIVYQLDRFARNRYDSATNKAKLKKNGVRVISARENITDDASGILMEAVLEGMAEYYSKELAQKVNRGMELNANKCLSNGGNISLGYKVGEDKKFYIDESAAPVVKKIFEMYASGRTVKEITDYLNERGLKTSKGNEWNKNSLNTMLQNKRYLGYYIYGKTEIKGGIPRIVSDELFEKVEGILEKNKKIRAHTKADEEYLLTTKLFCGHCKNMMTGISGKNKTDKAFYYYICNGRKAKKCNKKSIRKEYIENLVVKNAREQLTDENISIISKAVNEISKKENNTLIIADLKRKIKENEKAVDNLLNALENGEHIDLISGRITKKKEERAELETALINEQMDKTEISEMEIKFFLTELKKGNIDDIKYKKAIIALFVHAVYLYDDRLTIVFNASDKSVSVDIDLLNETKKSPDNGANHSSFIEAFGSPAKTLKQ